MGVGMTSERRGDEKKTVCETNLAEQRRLLYMSLSIVGRASGEDLGSETRFQTPGDAILVKMYQNLDFLDPVLLKGS